VVVEGVAAAEEAEEQKDEAEEVVEKRDLLTSKRDLLTSKDNEIEELRHQLAATVSIYYTFMKNMCYGCR
jgi:hypothetical protein